MSGEHDDEPEIRGGCLRWRNYEHDGFEYLPLREISLFSDFGSHLDVFTDLNVGEEPHAETMKWWRIETPDAGAFAIELALALALTEDPR